MPLIDGGAILTGLAESGIGHLFKRGYRWLADFRGRKEIAALKAEVIDLRSRLDAATRECARLKAVEAAQVRLIENQKTLQKKQAALLKTKEEMVRNLTAIIEDTNDFEKKVAEFDRTTVTEDGPVVYVNKRKAGVPYSPVYLCPKCYEDKKRSFLQPKDHFSKFCPECGTEYLFKKPAGPFVEIF